MATAHAAVIPQPADTMTRIRPAKEDCDLFDYGYKPNYTSTFHSDFGVPLPAARHDTCDPVVVKCGGIGTGKRSQALTSCEMARENSYYLDRLNAAAKRGELDDVKVVGEIPRPRSCPRSPLQSRLTTSVDLDAGNVRVEKITQVAEPIRAPHTREVLLLHHPGAHADPITIVKVPFPEGILDDRPEKYEPGALDEGLWTSPGGFQDLPRGKFVTDTSCSEPAECTPRLPGQVERQLYRIDVKQVVPAGLPNRRHHTNPITHQPRGRHISSPSAAADAEPDKITRLCPEHERLHYRYYKEFIPSSGKPAGRPVHKHEPIEGFDGGYGRVETGKGPPEHARAIISELKQMPLLEDRSTVPE